MRNGYFQLVNTADGNYGVKMFPPEEGGENFLVTELANYLDIQNIPYDLMQLQKTQNMGEETIYILGEGECPALNETYHLSISQDNMIAKARFYAPSETGKRITQDEFFKDMRIRGITYGYQFLDFQDHMQSKGLYCQDLVVARGKEPRHGTDAKIEYFFNTDVHARPTEKEDGSVDYFNLNVINHCHKGDLLARIIPHDEGEYGTNIQGVRIKPRDVKRQNLKYGNNVELSEDRLSITSMVDGHVMLVGDKVFVSNVYEVENVDNSTGNIDFNGSVQINGNVASNFTVKANGNVIINGGVEGAQIIANGNIIIARGMNGMGKGSLHAAGNIVVKFIESATVVAENGYVNAESILHSNVSAGDEVVVEGKKGLVTGGHVRAGNRVRVKTLGGMMGATTVLEVGFNPKLKDEYIQAQKDVDEIMKFLKSAQPILASYAEKKAKGVRFTPEQIKYVTDIGKAIEIKKGELQVRSEELQELLKLFEEQRKAEVEVTGEVYPGTTIVIGDASMVVQSSYKYCRFERRDGEVKMAPL